jgi:3-hydroxyisobutyrate dehydrogenase-like beta-hydroxyacid dehydrogenase
VTDVDRSTAGVVGLGAMGRPAAEYLAAAGIPTFAYDLDQQTLEAVEAKGVHPRTSLAELAGESRVMFVFVPSDDDVRTVCSTEDGLLAGARPGSVIAICSSALPETCEAIAAAAAERGVDVLDAALTGGVRGAEAGEINLLVGGDEQVLERIRPLLEPWCKSVHHLGGLGTGQVGKTVNNLVHWAQISAINEALRFGQRLGVAPSKLREALKDGPTDSRTLRELEQMRFTWHKKDLANAFAMARTVEPPIDLPVAETAREAMLSITVDTVAALLADKEPPLA